jgi:hypothetical protein
VLAAAIAALLMFRKNSTALVVAWIASLMAVYEVVHIGTSAGNEFVSVSIGYGVLLMAVGFIVALGSIIKAKRAQATS